MQKITVKELVSFRRKSARNKKSFAYKLKSRQARDKSDVDSEGGGDYWITSTSCVYNVFKYTDDKLYDNKIEELRAKLTISGDKRIKDMYQRNIDILNSFKDFDFYEIKPAETLTFEKVTKAYTILTIKHLPLYVNPRLIFSFNKNGKKVLGALWLIPQLEGFKKSELGLFCEMLFRFLIKNYSNDYQISEEYCIAIDTYNAQKVIYSELLRGDLPFLIDKTLEEINDS